MIMIYFKNNSQKSVSLILILLTALWAVFFLAGGSALADWKTPTITEYSKTPPFISREIPPNVIIAIDISVSMKAVAYRDVGAGNWKTGIHDDFDPTVSYYGYFDSTVKYSYDAAKEFGNYPV